MQINLSSYTKKISGWLLGATLLTQTVMAFDFNVKHKDISFSSVDVVPCLSNAAANPELPKDPKADFYYKVAQKIWGQEDKDHYKQMYILAEKSAQMGHWRAKLLAAKLYMLNSSSYYTEFKPEQARTYIDELMKQNVSSAFYAMSQNILNGYDAFKKDASPASVYLYEAAKLNHSRSLVDIYNVMKSVYREKEARPLLSCAVEQKDGNAYAFYFLGNLLEDDAKTEQEWQAAFKNTYAAIKSGSFDALVTLPIKEDMYQQLFSKSYLSQDFLGRAKLLEQAMSPRYQHIDPYRRAQDENTNGYVQGNTALTFPYLERILPLPPALLPSWNRNIGNAMEADDLLIYQTDFDYEQIAKEAAATK